MNSKLEAQEHHFWAEKPWSSKPNQAKEKSHPKRRFFALLKPPNDFSCKTKVNTWFSHVLISISLLKSGLVWLEKIEKNLVQFEVLSCLNRILRD